jgi:ATP-dependent helicase/nuclease subunit A
VSSELELGSGAAERGAAAVTRPWTDEQALAISRREGDLVLDAAAGSGKTSVLVERFVELVLRDEVDVGAILTITFTEKAAAEMRDRIRRRFRELGSVQHARATEGAYISTIHGFCARLLRAQALRAGIDPHFRVLDGWEAQRLADRAFEQALEALASDEPGALDLIAAYGPWGLRSSVLAVHAQLRSAGQLGPRLPLLPDPPDLDAVRQRLREAAAVLARELGGIGSPPAKVVDALDRLESCSELVEADEPWPGTVAALALPRGNGAALSTAASQEYAEALEEFRAACGHRWAARAHRLLDLLLGSFGVVYARLKRESSALDFDDLELLALELVRGDPELRERLRDRFERIMVDELQDTNRVQMELIDQLARGNLFMVGDAQQSIYGFRHADVELFRSRGQALGEVGARLELLTNFRSRPEILTAVNRVFEHELAPGFRPLRPGREEVVSAEPRVELLVADKGADWDYDGLASAWRVAEARALASRVAEVVHSGARPGEVVLLLRAATDMRVYERALEDRGIPTYVIGGRGYWSHPQVIDLVSYLRALANPRDQEAFYTVLASPLVGVSLDALVILAAAARAADRDPWWVVSDPEDRLDELEDGERERLARFATWFGSERVAAARLRVDQLIDRALERTGYDDAVLAMPGGQRRLANVRKLMRLGADQVTVSGDPLREFLELVRFRGWGGGDRAESEAPVEGDGLNAVRLMTIHRAKGLEFEIVCVADLGRGPHGRPELMRVGRDGRFGLRLNQPGTGRSEPALEYKALGDEQAAAESREERRLFYVAMTRARERLILSGAAKLDAWPANGGGGAMGWIGRSLVPEMAALAERREDGVHEGVEVRFVEEEGGSDEAGAPVPGLPSGATAAAVGPAGPAGAAAAGPAAPASALPAPPPAAPPLGVTEISYSALEEHRRCGYRFYAERVLRLPPVEDADGPPPGSGGSGMSAIERGLLVHSLLEGLDFRRPVVPVPALALPGLGAEEAEAILALVRAFTSSELCARLGRATSARSEQRFAFLLGDSTLPAQGILIRGVFDVIAVEPHGGTLVVDYKTDRLDGAEPQAVVESSYTVQRLVYALAALRAGAPSVEVVHTFLEQAGRPVVARFSASDAPELEGELAGLTAGMVAGEFEVSQAPHRALCRGCPAEGGLCSWPLALTRRAAPDQLF